MAAKWLALIVLVTTCSQITATVKCIYNGKEYHPGEQIPRDCNKCYCLQQGNWLCTQRTCRLTDFRGILLTPSNDVTIPRGNKLYVICKSERKRSRFMWFVNGHHLTSSSKISSILEYSESVLQLEARDFKRKITYVTCFVPPFAPKRIKVTLADVPSQPTGTPRIAPQPETVETSPNYGVNLRCDADGSQPMQITWFKFRVPLHSDNPSKWIVTPDGTLMIPAPDKSDSGLYECMATNAIGAAISSRATQLVINKGLPVKGGWCGWKQVSEKCNASCGGYLHFRRECACPSPKNGGTDCLGPTEKLIECNLIECHKEVYGKVNVDNMKKTDLLKGSCLHIGYAPANDCKNKKDCQPSSVITLRDLRIHRGRFFLPNYINYSIKLPGNLNGEFKFAALVQLGHCQERLSSYELFKDYAGPVTNAIKFSPGSSRALLNLNAHFVDKSKLLKSVVKFRPKIAKVPPESCLQILLWDDVICHGPIDCRPVHTFQISRPAIKDWQVEVNTPFPSSLRPGPYLVEGVLNIGWCANGSKIQQNVKPGDYVSLKKKHLFVDRFVTHYKIGLTIDVIKESEKKIDVALSGVIRLQDYAEQVISPDSCFTVEIREVYKCNETEGCRRPYISEKRVELTNTALWKFKERSGVPYKVIFRNVIGSKFEVNGLLNVGWCKDFVKGKRRTRVNDYFSVQSHEVNIDLGKSDFHVDLIMSKVVSNYGLRKKTVEGIIQYESRLSKKVVENSCLRLILVETVCNSDEECRKIPFIVKTLRGFLANAGNTIPFKINYQSQKKKAQFSLYAVMNVGWCGEGSNEAKSLRPGDLVGSIEMKRESSFVTIKLKRQNQFKFIDTPFKKADLDRGSSQLQISLSLPSEFGPKIPSSSCMVLTIREEKSCQNDLTCPDENVVKKVFRGVVKSRNNSVLIDMMLNPGLERNVKYQFDIVLNQGWCSEGPTNSSWIKDGDLFNSVEEKFKNSTTSPDIIENVAFRVFKDNDQKTEKCSIKCPRILDPVCGSDNRTYNSLCVLKKEACIFESGVTLLHKGECERCKLGCSTQIEPICARNGKTYDNLCIMEREACFEDSFLAFRHYGKCGSVTMRGDVRFSLDQPLSEIDAGSCLVIKTRKAVYCKFPEKCPDFELAEIVLKDVIVPPDGKIPYEIIMNPRPMSSVYLVEAVLNRGWCSAESNSKEWIRNEDYFNVKEQPFAVQGSEEIYKDIPVTKLVNLKVVDKGTIPSAIRDPCSLIDCPYHGTCHAVNGKAVCRCKLVCRVDSEPVCGSDGETYANECIMKSESCLSKKFIEVKHKGSCENALKISGDILIDHLIPRIPAGSCLNINIRKKCNESKRKCDIETLAEIRQKDVLIPPSNRMYYQTVITPRPLPGIYIISAVLNRGWCPVSPGSTEWIRIGDYVNYFWKEIEISETGNIEKDVIIATFVPEDDDRNYVIVEGEALLDGTDFKISNGSCMSISLHQQNETCNGNCESQPVLRYYVKNLSMFSGKNIPYRTVIKPRPKPGRYVLSVVLNQGWCSEGSSELIREGDLFINEGQELEIGLAGDVYKEVKVTKYYPPGMPCIRKDHAKVPNGVEITDNGNGCHGCKCNNGSIVCNPTVCPSLECSNGFLAIEDGDCCPSCIKYSKCQHPQSGRTYKNREEFFYREKDYCETCSCNMTGKFSCSKEVCPKLDCKKGIYIESSCCPVCASDVRCKDHQSGMLYKAGETWVNGEINGCSKCKCVTKPGSKSLGFIECIKPSCPRLNCIQQIYPKGYCCPICLKEDANGPFKEKDVSYLQALIFNEVVSSEVSCSDEANGKIYVEGEKWSRSCTNYECKRSGIESRAKTCPYLTCPLKYHVKKPGDCCPSCSAECLPKLFCTSDSLILIVPKIFLPYTRTTELAFSNCTSSGNATHFILTAAFNQCGVKRSIEGDLMKYSNMAYTREDENAVISRVQLVEIPVVCMYPANTQRILSQEFIKRNRGISVVSPIPKDTGPVKAFDVFMKIIDERGVELDAGKPMKFDPGEKVFVEIDGTGLVENKIKVQADYCYLTPTPGPKSVVNYTLIENGCAVDSTVEFQKSTGNGQHFSFRALVFTKTKVPGFYLHCDTVTCDQDDPACSMGCRQRRSLHQNQLKMISRKQSPDHKRKMKLTVHVVVG